VRFVLDRPQKLNALNGALVHALMDALDAAEADPDVRVIVLEGAGRAFCSGYDLTEEAGSEIGGPVVWRELLAADVAATLRFLDSPKPVIAQIHGYALAGGLELAMACDLIVAAEGTMLGEPEIRYGSAPVTLLMPYLIGQKRTRELLLTGDLIDAEEAERMGLVNRVVPADGLDAAVQEFVDAILLKSPAVIAGGKRAFYDQVDRPLADAYATAGKAMSEGILLEDAAEGMDAFLQKRTPAWRNG